jgi:phenylalanyl-tRNA synthetase beta chain
MFISLDWISDYVDLKGLGISDIVNRLTLATAEVEGTKEIRRFVKGVVIGEIKSAEKLTDKLTFCVVDCGSKTYSTVCGAPNVRVGLKAPFAPVGTVLADGVKIEKSEISGKPSQGILCSAAELGMSNWHEIILECPANIKPGTPLSKFVPETDTLIEIDNKSLTHRPDLWGHYGFAREFAAIFNRKLKPLPQLDLSQFDHLPAYPLKNEDYENCPCYGCIEFHCTTALQGLQGGTVPSPLFMQRRLHALGMRSYNLLVDVTNYVNWEIGQPTHAFDADKLGGIRVAVMGRQEKFETLDGQTRNLLPEDLLIWGSARSQSSTYRSVALAGIMGGLETEVTESTTKLLLESANFKAARIRRTSGRLDLKTDASQRYEKSQPPSNVKAGAARILKLIEESGADLKVLSRLTLDGDLQNEIRPIEIPVERMERLAGIRLPSKQILSILRSLGFTAEYQSRTRKEAVLVVGVPPFRSKKDISIPEDIIEEVLRVFGYDNIPPIMPEQAIKPLFIEKPLKMEHKIRRMLTAGHRFLEVHNYIWFNDLWLKTLGFEPVETLVLRNPTSPETSRLRTTLIPNLLALVPKNRPFRDSFRLFEIGRTFFSVGKVKECIECHHLAGIAFQQSGSFEDFYLSIKSAVEDILSVSGVKAVRFIDEAQSGETIAGFPWKSPDCWVTVCAEENPIGHLGVLGKGLMNKISPEGGQIVWFDIELGKIIETLYPEVAFVEPPRYPLSWQDFSLVWSVNEGFDKLESILDGFRNPLIVRREFLLSYKGKGLEKSTASYSFRFWIGSTDHTLSGEEIESFRQQFLVFIKEKNVALRT